MENENANIKQEENKIKSHPSNTSWLFSAGDLSLAHQLLLPHRDREVYLSLLLV